jgi:hypothetical protein
MKKTDRNANGEMRPEYDFAAMKGGVWARYIKRLRERTNIVVLEPEVAEAVPNEQGGRPTVFRFSFSSPYRGCPILRAFGSSEDTRVGSKLPGHLSHSRLRIKAPTRNRA